MELDRDTLVRTTMPLVHRLASNMAGRLPDCVEVADLTQAGFVGLLDAATKFDRDKGARFATYAERRIKGAMLDSLRGLDWAPRSVRRSRRAIAAAVSRLKGELGREPREDEIARTLGLELSELLREQERIQRADSPSERTVPVEEFASRVSDPNAIDPYRELEKLETSDRLARTIAGLTERERRLLLLYYRDELTMKEVGVELGVNESRISQIHAKLLAKLRVALG